MSKIMRNLFITLLLFVSFLFQLGAQEIIENPEKPLSKNAGRVFELKEVMRIRDGHGFYFSSPIGLKVDRNEPYSSFSFRSEPA